MWPFRKKPIQRVQVSGVAPTPDEIAAVSAAIRARNGQPDSQGFRDFADVALRVMRGPSADEIVARAMAESCNSFDVSEVRLSGHYLSEYPFWMRFLEYAKPAVAFISKGPKP